jgi:hypothetical protein
MILLKQNKQNKKSILMHSKNSSLNATFYKNILLDEIPEFLSSDKIKIAIITGALNLAIICNAFAQMTGGNAPTPAAGISKSNKSVTIVQKRKVFGSEIISRMEIPFKYLNYGVFFETTPVGLNLIHSNTSAYLGSSSETPGLYYPNPGYSRISFRQAQMNLHLNAALSVQDIYLGAQNQLFPYGASLEMKNYIFNDVTPSAISDKISELYKNDSEYEYDKYEESVLNNFKKNQTTVFWKKIGVFGGIYNIQTKTGISGHLSLNQIARQTVHFDNSANTGILNTDFSEKWILSPGFGFEKGFFSSYLQANWNFLSVMKSKNNPEIKSSSYYARFILALPVTSKIKFGLQSENYFDFFENTSPEKKQLESMFMESSDSRQYTLINGIQAYLKVQF